MARSARPLGPARGAAAVVALAITALFVAAIAMLAAQAQGAGRLGPADWAALRFTLWQALWSAGLSAGLAVPLARALARRRFWGRGALMLVMGAPFILPVIVAVLGLLAVFGRAGVLNVALGAMGLPPLAIYGFKGVVLAHVFFNLPLATRLILGGWASIPAERFRLAQSLRLPLFPHIERPMLRAVVPGAFVAVFLICLTSFAVALTLGGGPRATTIELAIYQAVRFDFDLGKAALLAALQFGICLIAASAMGLLPARDLRDGAMDRVVVRWDGQDTAARVTDALVILLAAVFLIAPLLAVAFSGLGGFGAMPAAIWPALGRTLAVALAAACIATGLALTLALRGGRLVAVAGHLPLAVSPFVLGMGLFLMLRLVVNPLPLALVITALANALAALPLAYRALAPEARAVRLAYGPLAASLAMPPAAQLRHLYLPRLRRPLGFALGLSAALSAGDLGIVALFANPGQETLPLLMYQLMGAYRMEAAGGVALLLLGLSLALFWLFDRGGRIDARG